jgi:ABC-type nitrate/sulfonate/bicarbonate transport system permease component
MVAAGLRIALPIALIVVVVAEIVGGQNGVGFYLVLSQSLFNIPGLFSAIVVLGLLGNVLNAAFGLAERRLIGWAKDV